MPTPLNRQLSVAPMMDCTDRHFRYLARLIHPTILLYSEMVTAAAIVHGDRQRLLSFNNTETPLALQLGGSDIAQLTLAAKVGEQFGYDEINLNVGCPSDRVQAGRFGACLMKEPQLVAECVAAMSNVVKLPITVKTRIGVDDQDSYELLCGFVETVKQAGCNSFSVHARKAWLKGLSPRENREIPPLHYEVVYQLKRDFPQLEIIINGGIKTAAAVTQHLQHVDGVMIGRAAYATPMLLATLVGGQPVATAAVVESYLPYMQAQLSQGVPLRHLIRPLIGLFHGEAGGRLWRRYLSENAGAQHKGVKVVTQALNQQAAMTLST